MTQEHNNKIAVRDSVDQSDQHTDTLKHAVREGFKSHTEGEKKFNNLTYKWVGYFGVTGFSVFLTWLIKDSPFKLFGGKRLADHFDTLVKWSAKKIDPLNPTKHEDTFRSFWTIGTLFTGGSIVSVLPIKWLEDNKVQRVKKYDRQIYGDEAVENDPQIVAAHKLLESQPKQGWRSVLGSRVTAFVATLGTWFIIGRNDGKIARKLGTSIDTLGVQFGRFADRIRSFNHPERIEKIHAAVRENMADARLYGELRDLTRHDSMFSRISSYIGMDGLYTIVTSVGLFVSTRFLGPIFDTLPGQKKRATEQPQQPISSPQEASGKDNTSNLRVHSEEPSPNVLSIRYQDRLANPNKTKNLESIALT